MNILAWFAKNGVAANLLMGLIVLGGAISLGSIRREVFTPIPTDWISVSVAYLGASPEEVEVAICSRIEERLQDLRNIHRLRSVAAEGRGTVTVELLSGSDVRRALDDVKSRVDAIDSFPAETEKPIIQEVIQDLHVLSVTVGGAVDERTLKRLGERVRDEISALEGVSRVVLTAVRRDEISIEVSERTLSRYGLTFDRVAEAVRSSSLDVPGGSVRAAGGEILLRTAGQAYRRREFEEIVLLTRADGTRLTLGEVAVVVDGFAEGDRAARFDGLPAVVVQVYRAGDQHATRISERVREYVTEARGQLPAGLELTVWQDDAEILKSRLSTLVESGRSGLVLVLLVLALFLRLRLAFWVALGIPISFLGALWLMPVLDLSIDLLSLLAFIVVLGIVVDDAIVVGENIYRHHRLGKSGLEAAVDGVGEVAVPVVFSVLTTIAAFAPLAMVPGPVGKIIRVIPLVAILALVFSLVESLLILPSHLTHLRTEAGGGASRRTVRGLQSRFAARLETFSRRAYRRALERAQAASTTTLAIAVAAFLLTVGFVAGGHIRFAFFPPVEAENLVAFLTMPQGTTSETTARALGQLESGARELQRRVVEEQGADVIAHVMTTVGAQPYRFRQSATAGQIAASVSGSHRGEVNLELSPAAGGAHALLGRWRELSGAVPDAVELTFSSALYSAGKALDVQLAGPDLRELRQAAEEVAAAVAAYPGVFDVTASFRAGKREARLAVTPEAESLGLTLSDLARQVRQAFYGEEVQRVQRGRDEVKVMVRYPEAERRSLASLEKMRIRTPRGDEVPFAVVGRMDVGQGFAAIERTDRRRTVNVTADVDLEQADANRILADFKRTALPEILARYPGLGVSLEGEQRQQRETMGGLGRSFLLALFVIYALLAVPFRSYLQPLIVMGAIPFGVIGAVWGHVLMGHDLTFFSLFGVVALTGVVVNDSLVLVDFTNRAYRRGTPLAEAVVDAGVQRFRPIVLTSLTTFAGLLPLLLETSVQAQFLIPMAISLAFGVLFATLITLFLVPVSYSILERLRVGMIAGTGRPAPAERGISRR